ncbi:hypothetical protein E4U43_005927 [Claviceps pusilla]|uniref:Uncharacterized protein n=1 Tax=Claviceps pusilla TaxID=123648 RepID=A0A9P7NE54_9HYPO|nr:hypothetical protein E4U43_005927 [Claviceps pusilla]
MAKMSHRRDGSIPRFTITSASTSTSGTAALGPDTSELGSLQLHNVRPVVENVLNPYNHSVPGVQLQVCTESGSDELPERQRSSSPIVSIYLKLGHADFRCFDMPEQCRLLAHK